jgi:ribosome-associated protein
MTAPGFNHHRTPSLNGDVEDLHVTDAITIPGAEIDERFSTSGGPGGQHANRSATRVVLSFDVEASSALDEGVRQRLLHRLNPQLRGGVLAITVDESRSQWRNRQLARRRLADVIREGLRTETRRIPTRPSRASQRRRVDQKKARGRTKRLRRPPQIE